MEIDKLAAESHSTASAANTKSWSPAETTTDNVAKAYEQAPSTTLMKRLQSEKSKDVFESLDKSHQQDTASSKQINIAKQD